MHRKEVTLLKGLGLSDSMAISLGIIIGVGIFRVPAEIAKTLVYPGFIILAWFLGGIFSYIGALCYAELSSMFPKTGGDYVYLRESYGLLISFLYAWVCLFAIRTGSIAAIAFVFAEYLALFFSVDPSWIKPIAASAVIVLSLVNFLGFKKSQWLQNISVLLKLLVLFGIILAGFSLNKSNFGPLRPFFGPVEGGFLPSLGLALVPILWTYGGWQENTYVSGETHGPQKTLPRALILTSLLIMFLYVCINVAYLYFIPVQQMPQAELIVSDVMSILFAGQGGRIASALVVIVAFGVMNGMIVTSGRITYAAGVDHTMFNALGRVHHRCYTPHLALAVNALISILLIIWGNFNKLLFFTGILVWLFFALNGIGLFILRNKFPNLERAYTVPGYPLTPLLFIAGCLGLVINSVIYFPRQAFMGMILLLSGIPAFICSNMQKKKQSSF